MAPSLVICCKSSHNMGNGGQCVEVGAWRKSSYSTGNGGECVEVARLDAAIGLRDSKNPRAGHLTVPAGTFAALLAHLKQGGPTA